MEHRKNTGGHNSNIIIVSVPVTVTVSQYTISGSPLSGVKQSLKDFWVSRYDMSICLLCNQSLMELLQAPSSCGPIDPSPPSTPREMGVCVSLKWEHRIAIPDCAPNPMPAWFCVSLSPHGLCRYLMHEPCSDPTAQQLKVLLTDPLRVCVCVVTRENTGLLLWSRWL